MPHSTQDLDDLYVPYARLLIERKILALQPPIISCLPKDADDIGPVGIIGGGVGGLYAAMLLQSLDIPYQILEASDRTGGRVFTYRDFKPKPNKSGEKKAENQKQDYFDVGAARFPKIAAMKRLFDLFNCEALNPGLASDLVPYIFNDPNTFRLYNGTRYKQDKVPVAPVDAFKYSIRAGGNVEQDFINGGYQKVYDEAMSGFIKDILNDPEAGIRKLMRFDQYSVRGYMADCLKLPGPIIDWCETMNRSTGGYDLSLTQTVLNMLPFSGGGVDWYRLKGGAQVLPAAMEQYIRRVAPADTIQFGKVVTGIRAKANPQTIELKILGEEGHRSFGHVISTIPMTCLRTLDLDDCPLTFDQRNTIRMLQCEPAIKIGVKFLTAWWRDGTTKDGQPLSIKGGHSYTDRCVRIVVYPSCEDSTVLIASYCSSRDALLLGGLIDKEDRNKERLKELVLRDLAAIHDVEVSKLESEYQDLFGYDWGHAPFAQGAFAFFGPGQFSTLYTNFSHAAAYGRLHFAGEALSVRHAWIVGTLDASWRAVLEILLQTAKSHSKDKIKKFFKLWDGNREWDMGGKPEEGNLRAGLLLKYALGCNPELFEEASAGRVLQELGVEVSHGLRPTVPLSTSPFLNS